MAEIMVAAGDAAVTLDGIQVVILYGQTLADSRHEIVTRHPGLWKPLDVHYAVAEPVPAAKAPAARKAPG
jgi:hypothetical protein